MLNAIRSVRIQPSPALFSSPLPYHIGRKTSSVRFHQASAGAKDPKQSGEDMDQRQQHPTEKTGSVRIQPSPALFSSPLPYHIGRKTSSVRFHQASAGAKDPKQSGEDMDQRQQHPTEKTGDVMSHSFGEGYATRSDEEGFGGMYGGNDSTIKEELDTKKQEDKDIIHENHPDYDKSQGSEAAMKEKARNQHKA